MEFANGGSFDHPPRRIVVKTGAIRNFGPGAPACQAKPRAFNPAELASAPSHREACFFAAVSDEPSRPPVVVGSVFCLPLGLWLECSNAQMEPTNSNERKKGIGLRQRP